MNIFDAAGRGDADAMRALLAAETDVDRMEENGRTALMVASAYGRKTSVEMLLAAGANVNHSPNGITPLMWASWHGHAAIVKLLRAKGADVDHATRIGETALMYASYLGHAAVVDVLLTAGADVNMADINGCTALTESSGNGNAAVVEMLLAAGADVNRVDGRGRTALTLARSWSHGHTAVALLEDAERRARARHLLGKWRAATRLWRLTNWWWRVAGKGQHAPGMPGHKRARVEFEAACAA
jgi:ankyrin repeat protein